MTDKKQHQPEPDTQHSDVAPDEVTEKRTKPSHEQHEQHERHRSQVPDINPPSVQPGHRDRERV